MTTTIHLDEHYTRHIEGSRQTLRRFCGELIRVSAEDPRVLLAALVELYVLHAGVLRARPQWLKESAERCIEVDYRALAADLERSAVIEHAHRKLLIDDLCHLGGHWQRYFGEDLDLYALIQRELDVHEARLVDLRKWMVIAVPTTVAAFDYEFSSFIAAVAPRLLDACEATLGARIHDSTSFLQARLGDTAVRQQGREANLDAALAVRPEQGGVWVRVNQRVMKTYVETIARRCELAVRAIKGDPPRPPAGPRPFSAA